MALAAKMMALTASSASPKLSSSPSISSPIPKLASSYKPHLKPLSLSFPTSTTLSLFAVFASPFEAKALTLNKDEIVSTLTEVEKTVDQAQQVGSGLLDTAQKVFGAVSKTLKPGIDAAMPVMKQAGEEALKIASPALSEASKKAQEALQSSGLDPEPVVSAAKTAADAAQQTTKVIEGVKPVASSTIETILSADPVVIVASAGAAFLAYLLLPPVWSLISFNFRGYKGDLTPAQTLDRVSTSNHVLIDIRSEKDKDKAGIPRLPSNAKNKLISIPLEELPSKVKGLVRSAKKLEAEIAALKISYLKKINKGSNIVILDSYSDSAKIVARTLTNLGFKNCYIVADGFSGGRGWVQSRLGTDSYNFSFAQVLSPSRIIPSGTTRFGTTTGTKLLPGAE